MNSVKIYPAGRISHISYFPSPPGKRETILTMYARVGCDEVTNGPLFDSRDVCWWVMSAGKWLTNSVDPAYGLHMDGSKYAVRHCSAVKDGDFIAFYCLLLLGGKKQPIGAAPDFVNARPRTAYGVRADGALIRWVSDTAYTAAQMADKLLALGCVDGGLFDGGGSSQMFDGETCIDGDGRGLAGCIGISLNAAHAGRIYSKTYNGRDRVAPHFTVGEFACKDGSDIVLMDARLPGVLEDIRGRCGGKPVSVNSGYRTPAYNKSIKGAEASQHLTGSAADITIPGVSTEAVCKAAEAALAAAGIPGGVGRYVGQGFVHVDVRPVRTRWQKDSAASPERAVEGWAESRPRPTLRKGDTGPDVEYLQQRLAYKGHNITRDGVFGSKTETAVKAYQKKTGLVVDGVCGPKTWAALEG